METTIHQKDCSLLKVIKVFQCTLNLIHKKDKEQPETQKQYKMEDQKRFISIYIMFSIFYNKSICIKIFIIIIGRLLFRDTKRGLKHGV